MLDVRARDELTERESMWRRLLILPALLIQGCATHHSPSDYPENWAPLVEGEDVCRHLNGRYDLYNPASGGFDDIYRMLLPPSSPYNYKRLDSISIELAKNNVLHIVGYHVGNRQVEATYSEKDGTFSCSRDGLLIKNRLSDEKYIHDPEFANIEVNATHLLQEKSGNLIVKIDYTGAGLALFVTSVYSGTRWKRLEVFQAAPIQPRLLSSEQANMLRTLGSAWATIPGSTSHQEAAVFVESSIRTRARTFEIEDLADQIADCLKESGWDVDRNQVTYHIAFEGVGVGILTSSNPRGIEVGQQLAKALNSAGIEAAVLPQRRPSCEDLDQATNNGAANPRCSQISIFVGYHL
jgi:hypothetical protein